MPPPKALKLGDSLFFNKVTVPIGGGSYNDGYATITFPPNSYSGPKTVTFSTNSIKGSTFGANITPITPLYTIDAGSDFSNKDIIIDIPLTDDQKKNYTLDTNNFSMAFFYDKITHEIEGIPTIGYVLLNNRVQLSIALRRSGSFFISTIAKSNLASNVSSSFDPKQDNWEFPNFGTSLTPDGQFAGQSLSALWYYYEQTLSGKAHLYGQYDLDHGGEPPKIWQDNDLGFRVAAETQQALKWNNYSFDMIKPLKNGDILLTSDQVIYSMMVTGKPQIITVMKDSTLLPLIVYKVSNGQFYVSDPNYPISESQSINATPIHDNKYYTGLSMFDLSTKGTSRFDSPTYIGVRAMIDWDAIAKIWTDAQNNIFSTYAPSTISFSDALGNLKTTEKGFQTIFDTVTYKVTGNPSSVWVYQNSIFSSFTSSNTISLKPGANLIYMYFQNQSPDNIHSVWNGFRSVSIQKQTFSLLPALDSSFVENNVVLHAVMGSKPTESLRYEWDMGDGSRLIKNINVDTINYRYQKTGTFIVTLAIYQVSSNTLLGKETSTVVIEQLPTLAQLQSMRFVTVSFLAKNKYEQGDLTYPPTKSNYDAISTIVIAGGAPSDTSSQRIIWNGNSFTTSYQTSSSYNDPNNGPIAWTKSANNTIVGNVNNEFTQVNISAGYSTSNWDRHFNTPVAPAPSNYWKSQGKAIVCQSISLVINTADSIIYLISGASLQYVVTRINDDYTDKADESHGAHYDRYSNYVSTYWDDPINIPTVKLTFHK